MKALSASTRWIWALCSSLPAVVMKSPPKFLRGAYRAAMRIALKEIIAGETLSDEVRQTRGWKLFLLLPRMLLFRPPRGGLISRQRLFDRFTLFNQGAWIQLLIEGRECCEAAVNAGVRRRRRTMNDSIERKAERAQMLVMMGVVSSGRRALEGAPLAPGNDATLAQLRRRPQEPREPLPQEITGRRAESPFSLDHSLFMQNLRCARRGAAAGPSGVTAEHLKPILDIARASLEGPVLLSSPAKLEDGGQRKHGISCDTWPKQELVGNLSLSNEERRLHG